MRDLVAVLAEPNRRRLLELLVGGEQTVSALASQFGVTRSAVSQHLGVLAGAGLVTARQQGRFRYYRVVPEGLAELRSSLDVFWGNELKELAAAPRPAKAPSPAQGGIRMTLEKSVLVPLGPDETFALITEPERLRRWHTITARIDLRAGGDYRFTIVPGHTASGKVKEIEPGRRVVLTWGWEDTDDLPPGASTVTITLEPVDGGTLVRLVHDGLTEKQAEGHGAGWDHYLERLAAAAHHGDAGPDAWSSPTELDRLSAAEASLAVCQSVLRGMSDSDGTLPTPCAKFNVDDLVTHLLGSISHLGAIAGTEIEPGDGISEVRVADASQRALEAWRKRGVDGQVAFGSMEVPATMAVGILSLELLVHAWDFAQASSQELVVSPVLSEYVLGLARETIAPQMRDGDRFAAEVDAGVDADNLQRLVAFTGRAS